ncbi:hypothetical protein [Thermotoga sp. Ku-13t]|uniref:hypothetical protein n=1 Tax=Thermotoga sp. Ku-13t TaxID=1755813 RepID=UPI0013EE11CB|nr:hypothetical protein [Thermotoga sp. Ku-13t]
MTVTHKFKCINCGDESYSAASLEYQKFPRCEKCGGKILRVHPPMKLGEILIALGMINDLDLQRALKIQNDLSEHLVLGKLLIKLKLISTTELERALRLQRDMMGGTAIQ